MGLFDIFDSDHGNEEALKKGNVGNFSVRRTNSIPRTLKQFALDTKVPVTDLDFDLIHVRTTLTMPGSEESVEIDGEVARKLRDEGKLLDPNLVITQNYEINVFPKHVDKEFDLKMQLSVNKVYSRAKAVIKKESVFKYSPALEGRLVKELNKRKLRSGMLIDIFDEKMRQGIKNMVTKIRVNDRLDEDYVLELCHWIDPLPTVNDAIRHHAEDKKGEPTDEKKRVDYRERGFITTIEAGEVAVEYIKPLQGTPGRNFKGQLIPAPEPKVLYEPKFIPDPQSIDIKETSEKILYIAKVKGYVNLSAEELRIADELEIDEANFRATGNINAEQDKDIKIALGGKGKEDDNIGPNTKVEATEIRVGGSVANGAEVRAGKVAVQGQTHKTSKIFAQSASINIHRGYVEAKQVHVNQLENGVVVANEVTIDRAIGGTIRAKKIEIDTVYSNVKLVASRSIVIKTLLKGSDNSFIIEPAATVEEKKILKGFQEEIKELQTKVNEMRKAFQEKQSLIKQAQETSGGLKEKIMRAKQEGRMPSQSDIDRYKAFVKTLEEVKDLQDNLEVNEEKLSRKKDEITIIQDAALHAKITNMSGWKTHNKVHYKLIDPEGVVEYIPKVGMGPSTLTLRMVGENDYNVDVELL